MNLSEYVGKICRITTVKPNVTFLCYVNYWFDKEDETPEESGIYDDSIDIEIIGDLPEGFKFRVFCLQEHEIKSIEIIED